MVRVNPAKGDAVLKLDGKEYVLRADLDNMAAFQAAVGVEGVSALLRMVGQCDARALRDGVECLAVSGDVSELGKSNFMVHMADIQTALLAAITGGVDKESGNAGGETATK